MTATADATRLPYYQEQIRDTLARTGHVGRYSREQIAAIESFMRLECGTLDWLTPARWNREVEECRQCVDACTPDEVAAYALEYL